MSEVEREKWVIRKAFNLGRNTVKAGKQKEKGSKYERQVCRKLSLWITRGARTDCFWRSAMSGGRATVAKKKEVPIDGEQKESDVRQSGDITSVSPEGHVLTDAFFIEVKHLKTLSMDLFFTKFAGPLRKAWDKAVKQAYSHDKWPMLIAKQNLRPAIVLVIKGTLKGSDLPVVMSDIITEMYLHRKDTLEIWLFDGFKSMPKAKVKIVRERLKKEEQTTS
jgi:hypothetical protein